MTRPVLPAELNQFQSALQQRGVPGALEHLASRLREGQRFHELFEALKMRVRHELGLPLSYSDSGDELDEATRARLEEGLLDACREVGTALLRAGAIREGWMYLRPVGDRKLVAAELAQIETTEDNLDQLIDVTLHEGVDTARGFSLILQHHGTCNAITTYESIVSRQGNAAQQAAAGLLVEHVHRDLLAAVRADIARNEGKEPLETTLGELVRDRDWLFGEYSYHLDTTHLASTVRASRVLQEPRLLRLAVDLTEYGRRLSPQFRYKGEPPFEDLYPTHALYLRALLGEDIDEALKFFRERAESLDPAAYGSLPTEAYVQLLDRLGRYEEAVRVLVAFVEKQPEAANQVIPLMLNLSQRGGDFATLTEYCRQRGDLLGFASALLHQATQSARG